MPLHKNEPHEIITFIHHPPIYHQKGHFFYPDGFEVSPQKLIKLLRHHPTYRPLIARIAEKHHLKHLLSEPPSKAESEYDEQIRKEARYRR